MGLVTIGQALVAADRATEYEFVSVQKRLKEAVVSDRSSFDVFLSHSKMDDKYVLGAKQILEEKGYSVYVDWIDDPQFDRSRVTKKTAEYLRGRMEQCDLMFYLHSKNAKLSKWCPWELGFFDARSGKEDRTFVFPLVWSGQSFEGQEYLELYPLVDIDNVGLSTASGADVWAKFPTNELSSNFKAMNRVLSEVRSR